MKGLTAYSLSRKYTEDTADALGAVKGAPCQIDKIEYDEEAGTVTITFSWVGDSGQVQTDIAVLHNGKDGADGSQVSVNPIVATGTKIAEITIDGTKYDLYSPSGGGGGGSSELEDDLKTSVAVGGIKSGTTYEAGTSLETLFRDMLNPVAYPTLTNPSASLSATGAKLLETGATLNTTFTISFNRGSINPAYGTSGYRSGAATSYTFDGETKSTNTFTRTITSAKISYQGSVAYDAGEQPKDSEGKNYQSPLPAGSVNTGTVSYEFVDAIWANTSDITTVAKLALVSKSAKVKELSFPAQTVANPEIFDVPASWTVTAVEVLNTLSGQWESCISEFTVTNTTHDDASGTAVNYKRYTDNRGYNAGARKVRFKWS